MAMKDRQNPGPRVHFCKGIWEGKEGGRVGRLSLSFTQPGGVASLKSCVHFVLACSEAISECVEGRDSLGLFNENRIGLETEQGLKGI